MTHDAQRAHSEDPRPGCKHENPFTDDPCILVPPHDRLHLDEHGERWFYDDPEQEQKRLDMLAQFRRQANRALGR